MKRYSAQKTRTSICLAPRSLAKLALCTLTVLCSPLAMAQSFTGTYNLAGSTNNVSSLTYNGTAITDLTVGALSKVGFTSVDSTGNFRGSNWSLGATTGSDTFTGSIDTTKYIEFTLTAASGKVINLPTITFGVGRSGTGPRQWQWRSSVDNYAAAMPVTTVASGLTHASGVLTNPDSNSSWTGNIIATSGSAYQNLTSITFRLYAYNSEGTGGTGGLQGNLTFGGTLAQEGVSDTTPPSLVSRQPSDDASAVIVNSTLILTYNEAVKAGTGTATIRLSSNGDPVQTISIPSAQCTIVGGTVTLTPPALLVAATDYYVELTEGAIVDLADNLAAAISGSTAWNFATRAAPSVVISQYYEGVSSDKYIELKNLTASPLSLSGYRLAVWANADRELWKSGSGVTDRVTDLSAYTIPANGYFLIKDTGAAAPGYAANNSDASVSGATTGVAFSGDDSVVLYNGAGFSLPEVVDAFSVVANTAADQSFYRANDNPGFDFTTGSSLSNYPSVWLSQTTAAVASAQFEDAWYLRATQDPQTLSLGLSGNSFSESAGMAPATATVTRTGSLASSLQVNISFSPAGYAGTDNLVLTIPENEASATFPINAIDNNWKSGNVTVTIGVASTGYTPDSETLTVQDDPADAVLPVVINEVESDSPGTDNAEFVELYNNSASPVSLNGVTLVLFNSTSGTSEVSYLAVDLSSHSIPANGFFVIGNAAVTQASVTFSNGDLQNGPDAVALFVGVPSMYPANTLASAAPGYLVDAVVYGTADADATVLLSSLTPGKVQVDEGTPDPDGTASSRSISRVPDGGARFASELYVAQTPTPGATNVLPITNTLAVWMNGYSVEGQTAFLDDYDKDGLVNALENILGSSPASPNQGLTNASRVNDNLVFRHTRNATPAADLTASYEWSTNLSNWNASAASFEGTTVAFGAPSVVASGTPDLVEVTATVTGTIPVRIFARLKVVSNAP